MGESSKKSNNKYLIMAIAVVVVVVVLAAGCLDAGTKTNSVAGNGMNSNAGTETEKADDYTLDSSGKQ
jgi:hypothetical protein